MKRKTSKPERSLTGVVQGVTYVDGFFRILEVAIVTTGFDWEGTTITVTGNLGPLVVGDYCRFTGCLQESKRYGIQFQASRAERLPLS